MTGEGNRCGHDPANPRWFDPPVRHNKRPGILAKLGEKIRAYYREPAATIPSLNLANGSPRQQRSERREACIQFLGGVVHYLDLVTLRVGIPQADGSFQGLTMAYLAEVSGLGQRRAERAIADLAKAGIITVHPLAHKIDDCAYKGFAAIRTVSAKLFTIFGLGQWLRHERDKASARRRKAQRKAEAVGLAKLGLLINGASNGKARPAAKAEATVNRTLKLKELMAANPDRPIEELFELLRAPP